MDILKMLFVSGVGYVDDEVKLVVLVIMNYLYSKCIVVNIYMMYVCNIFSIICIINLSF